MLLIVFSKQNNLPNKIKILGSFELGDALESSLLINEVLATKSIAIVIILTPTHMSKITAF